ncbi:MAG: hypothetical protein ACREOE_04295 [Gemmatimonadales bacterium]
MRDAGEQRARPGFHPGQGFVAGGQRAAGDQDVPQVAGGAGPRVEVSWPEAMSAGSRAPVPPRSQFSAVRGVAVLMMASRTPSSAAGT